LGTGTGGFSLGRAGLIGSNTGNGADEAMGTVGFMSRFNLAGVTGVTVGSLGLAIGAERKSSKPPAGAVPPTGVGTDAAGAAGLKRSSNPVEGEAGIVPIGDTEGETGAIEEAGVANAAGDAGTMGDGVPCGDVVGFGTGIGCDIAGAAIEGDGAMIGPAAGVGAFIAGVVSKSSKIDPVETFGATTAGAGACGLGADGTSTSISMASSSVKTSSEDEATASVLTGALGAGAFKSPRGSSSSILCFKTSNPGLGVAPEGEAAAGDKVPAWGITPVGAPKGDDAPKENGAGVPKDSTLVSFSQLAQMGCILESSPKQAPQKKRWQRLQLPTASRSAWFTQGVPGISQPFR